VQLGIGWLIIADFGESASTLGLLGAAIAIPSIIVNIFGGVIADRMDRRYIMIVTSAVNATLMTILALLVTSGIAEVWHLIVIAAVQGFFSGLDGPVKASFFPLLVSRKNLMSAVALSSVTWHISRIISPSIGGLAIRYMGTESVFFAGALGWIAMLAVIISLRVPYKKPEVQRRVLQDLTDGVKFIARSRFLSALILLSFAKMFFGMQYLLLMPLFAVRHGLEADGLGIIFVVLSAGAISGTIIAPKLQRSNHAGKSMIGGAFVFTFFVTGFAFAPSYGIALIAIYGAGVVHSVFLVISMTAIQMRLPSNYRGRVMGIYTISFALMPLGGLLGGNIAEIYDERWALTFSAGILMVIMVIAYITQSELRNLRGDQLTATEMTDA
jgi:MFS family permease